MEDREGEKMKKLNDKDGDRISEDWKICKTEKGRRGRA